MSGNDTFHEDDHPHNYLVRNIFDKSINFLIGSGSSADYIPTLTIDRDTTYETLLTQFSFDNNKKALILFQYYTNIVSKCYCNEQDIEDSVKDTLSKFNTSGMTQEAEDKAEKIRNVLPNYKGFINQLIPLLERRQKHSIHRANIFTTNYDLFIEKAADSLHKEHNFILNDGSQGLITRKLNIGNFHLSTVHQGTHDNYKYEIPTINLIKMHGSVSWDKESDETVNVIYSDSKYDKLKKLIEDNNTTVDSLNEKWENAIDIYTLIDDQDLTLDFDSSESAFLQSFVDVYQDIAIVNPTKEKFSETVFQQHYYQSLRLLSYELEKPQAVLICFGFSFQDEHIRDIILRSLTNRQLQVYVFLYSDGQYEKIPSQIKKSSNVLFIFTEKIEIEVEKENGEKEKELTEIKRTFKDFISLLFKDES